MDEFLRALGALSLGGALAALILMAAGRLTRSRYTPRWRCWAWWLLCLRLAMPLPLLPLPSQPQPPIQLPAPALEQPVQLPALRPGADAQPGPAEGAGSLQPPGRPEGRSEGEASVGAAGGSGPLTLSQLLFGLWLLGAAGVLTVNLAAHLRFCRYLRRWSRPVTDPELLRLYNILGDRLRLDGRPRLITCPGAPVPRLAGLFSPVLLLPQPPPGPGSARYPLLHELHHYRRRDIWLKGLSLWVCALHWFNPAVWLMSGAIRRDTELACDEAALGSLPRQEYAAYGSAILEAAARDTAGIKE